MVLRVLALLMTLSLTNGLDGYELTIFERSDSFIKDSHAYSYGYSNEISVMPTLSPTRTRFPSAVPQLTYSFDFSYTDFSFDFSYMTKTVSPSIFPSSYPTLSPSVSFDTESAGTSTSASPTLSPTISPTTYVADVSTPEPTLSLTSLPNLEPPTLSPSASPTLSPTISTTFSPSVSPTSASYVADASTPEPTSSLTSLPNLEPPTLSPSASSTLSPTFSATFSATFSTSVSQTSASPTSASPTSASPTFSPIFSPTYVADAPTPQPSYQPSLSPPSASPTSPTLSPTLSPTFSPSASPTFSPSASPTSASPTLSPTFSPTYVAGSPTPQPSYRPSGAPTFAPSYRPAPLISISSIQSDKNNVIVKVNSFGVCKVFCAAFDPSQELFSTDAIISQNIFASTIDDLATLTINNLIPSTAYSVYCTSTTEDGMALSLIDTKKTKTAASTLCCKTVLLSINAKYVTANTNVLDAFSVLLDSPVSAGKGPLTVSISINSLTLPLLTFSDVTKNTFASASLTTAHTANAGDYNVVVTFGGAALSDYGLSFDNGLSTIRILGVDQEPGAPIFLNAMFSNDGGTAVFSFDSSTNRGDSVIKSTNFDCSKLFDFNGVGTATCQWTSDTTVVAYLGSTAVLNVNDAISLKANIVKAKCTNSNGCPTWVNSAAVKVLLMLSPSSAIVPQVVITSPNLVGVCDVLVLDLSGSVGAGGRTWSSIIFDVTGPDVTSVNRLKTLLNTQYTISPPTKLSLSGITVGSYTFTVALTNFLGQRGSGSKTVVVTSSTVPTVAIIGSSLLSIKTAETLSVQSDAYLAQCDGTVSRSGLIPHWQISSNSVVQNLPSASKQSNIFKLNPYKLSVLNSYKISATYSYKGNDYTASTNVYVQQSDLVAVIVGGNYQIIEIGGSLLVDASKSYDEDDSKNYQLQYLWKCTQVFPDILETCGLESNSLSQSTITFTEKSGTVSAESRVMVTVYDASRTSSSSLRIVTVPSGTPSVTIKSSFAPKINTDSDLILSGALVCGTGCTGTWSGLGSPSSLQFVASQQPYQQNFIISAANLPQRTTLTFTLQAVSSSGLIASSTITVVTNGSPLPGIVTTSPTSGTELSTLFVVAASQWSDPDLPLTYAFGFHDPSREHGSIQTVQSRSPQAYAATLLPSGIEKKGFIVTVTMTVFDSYLSSATMSSNAAVNPVESSKLGGLVSGLLDNAVSVDEVKMALATCASAINKVSCALATNSFCSLLNRNDCQSTKNTCGECKDGFSGDEGDANSLCSPTSQRRLANVLSNQLCPSADPNTVCSGHGSCLFVDTNYGGIVSTCSIGDPRCTVKCACDSGYGGSACSLTLEEIKTKQTLRSSMIQKQLNLTNNEDESVQSVQSWVAATVSLMALPDEISSSSSVTVATLLDSILDSASSVKISYKSITSVLDCVDANMNIPSMPISMDTALLNAHITLLEKYNKLVLAAIVSGEPIVSSIYRSFRSVVSAVQVTTNVINQAVAVLTTPSSTSESIYGIPVNTLIMTVNSNQRNVKVSATTLRNLPVPKAIQYNPMLVQFGDADNDCPAGGCSVSVTFTNMNMTIPATTPSLVTTQCSKTSGNVAVACPNGFSTTVSCPTDTNGYYTTACPVSQTEAVCGNFVSTKNPYSFSKDSSCAASPNVQNHHLNSMLCACSVTSTVKNSTLQYVVYPTQVTSQVVSQFTPITPAPSPVPSLSPTAAPSSTPVVVMFTATYSLKGLATSTLGDNGREGLLKTSYGVMQLLPKSVDFVSEQTIIFRRLGAASSEQQRSLASSYKIEAVVKITLSSSDYPASSSDMTALYSSSKGLLTHAASSGLLATTLNANNVAVTSVGVVVSAPDTTLITPTPSPTRAPTKSKGLSSGGFIAMWVIISVVITVCALSWFVVRHQRRLRKGETTITDYDDKTNFAPFSNIAPPSNISPPVNPAYDASYITVDPVFVNNTQFRTINNNGGQNMHGYYNAEGNLEVFDFIPPETNIVASTPDRQTVFNGHSRPNIDLFTERGPLPNRPAPVLQSVGLPLPPMRPPPVLQSADILPHSSTVFTNTAQQNQQPQQGFLVHK